MDALLLEITARRRPNPLGVADPSDFEFVEGPAVDPLLVRTGPQVSLYCVDHPNRRALFVQTKPGVDLSEFPFLYQAQYENALRLVAVPYATLHQLADGIELDSRRLIFVYSVGRSGSTLLGAALNAVPGVTTLSEPDVFTQLVALRGWDGTKEDEISALVKSCMKLSCKPAENNSNPLAWAVKFRSFGIELGDLLRAHFPDAKTIFLYRQAEQYVASALRAFVHVDEDDLDFRAGVQARFSKLVPLIGKHVREDGSILSAASIAAMLWLSTMDRIVELSDNGLEGLAVRYEDLKAAPLEIMQKVLDYCELSESSMDALRQVLARDSQAGSAVARDRLDGKPVGLSDRHRADLQRVLEAHSRIRTPDFMLPGTWTPE